MKLQLAENDRNSGKLFLEETDTSRVNNVDYMRRSFDSVGDKAAIDKNFADVLQYDRVVSERSKKVFDELSSRSKEITPKQPDSGKFKPKKTMYTTSLKEGTAVLDRAVVGTTDEQEELSPEYISKAREKIFKHRVYIDYFEDGEDIYWDFLNEKYKHKLDYLDSNKKVIDKDSARSKAALDLYTSMAFGREGEGVENFREKTVAINFSKFVRDAFIEFVNRLGFKKIGDRLYGAWNYLIERNRIDEAQNPRDLFDVAVGGNSSPRKNAGSDSLSAKLKNNKEFNSFYDYWKNKGFAKSVQIKRAARYLLSKGDTEFMENPEILLDFIDKTPASVYMRKGEPESMVGEGFETRGNNDKPTLTVNVGESYRSDMLKDFTKTLTNKEVADVYRKFADALEHADDDENEESREFYRNLVAQAEAIAYHSDGDYNNGHMIDDGAPNELVVALRDLFDCAEYPEQ